MKDLIFCQRQRITGQIIAVNVFIVLVNTLSQCFVSRGFYYLCIVGRKLHGFVDYVTMFVNSEVIAVSLFE